MMKTRAFKNKLEMLVFVGPALVLILLMAEIPFVMSLYYSLTKWNGIGKTIEFIGLKNFTELFTADAAFWKTMLFTLQYTVFNVILTNVAAIVLAVVLTKALKSANILRAAFFVPYIVSLVIIGFIWKFIFTKGFEALFTLTGWGFFEWSWLGDVKLAFTSVLFVSVWQAVGFYMMIYITGLQSVPGDVLEAAEIDGATGLTRFFKITLPLLMPSFTIAVFLSLANSLKIFDIIYTLTFGGPGNATRSVTLDIYTEAFVNNRFGYATAKSLMFVVLILIITLVQVNFFKSKEVEA
ncbi:carbohydrate ABC transporter permease [Paenibacillus sp. y28]|uniref:carbohydrate ABC transporter permease n=1 Tax=Paenibacillus sp. y28 TaxID=3129110 RepID=UPI0030191566